MVAFFYKISRSIQSGKKEHLRVFSGRSGCGHLVLLCAECSTPCPLLCRRPAAQMGVASQIFPRCVGAEKILIQNAEHFTQIDLDLSDFEKERNQWINLDFYTGLSNWRKLANDQEISGKWLQTEMGFQLLVESSIQYVYWIIAKKLNRKCWQWLSSHHTKLHMPIKGRCSSSWEPHLRTMGHHLSYGITQCHLPPDTSERTPPNPSHAGWYSIYLPQRDGRLSWPSWLDSAPAGSQPSDLSITSLTPNHCTTKTTHLTRVTADKASLQEQTLTPVNVNITLVDCFVLNFSISTKDTMVPWTTFRLTGAWHRSLT